ncbi:hypothetical protein [Nannocystis pusilla]|uniref:hypothetical protein n=1 Tax=Nannocystis pusilla TaxID=889268 RepID=UPI003B774687
MDAGQNLAQNPSAWSSAITSSPPARPPPTWSSPLALLTRPSHSNPAPAVNSNRRSVSRLPPGWPRRTYGSAAWLRSAAIFSSIAPS